MKASPAIRLAIATPEAADLAAIRQAVATLPGCEVIWTATTAASVLESVRRAAPDLLLLDVHIPGMTATELTRQVMARTPCAILLLARALEQKTGLIFEAMGQGALDAVCPPLRQPDGTLADAQSFLRKVRALAMLASRAVSSPNLAAPPANPSAPAKAVLVAIGVSTGGPAALARLFNALPVTSALACVVIQHIDSRFSKGLVKWLGEQTPWPVLAAEPGKSPVPGAICLAVADEHLLLDDRRRFLYSHEPASYPYRPSVNVFFNSLADTAQRPGIAALLTGMGDDGAAGLLRLRQAGWHTIAQDQATSTIYGMPRVAAELNAACQILPLPDIPAAISRQAAKLAAGN